MHSAKLVCILWFAILVLALPQSEVETVTKSAPTPTLLKKTPRFWRGFISLPSPKPKSPAIDLQRLSSILIPGLTPMPMPTTRKAPGSTLIITITPGGGATTVTSVITSVVIASPPPSTVTVWVPPSNAAKREEQFPEAEDEDAPFIPTSTDLPEAALGPQEEQDDYNDAPSLPPHTNQPTLLRRKNKLPTPKLTLGQLIAPSNAGDLLICTEPNFRGKCKKLKSTTYKCHNFPADMVTNIRSVRPDAHQQCNLYTDWNCNMRNHVYMRAVKWPGWNDLKDSFVHVDNGILSWECRDDGCVGEQTEGGCHENADGSPKVPSIGGKPYNGANPP